MFPISASVQMEAVKGKIQTEQERISKARIEEQNKQQQVLDELNKVKAAFEMELQLLKQEREKNTYPVTEPQTRIQAARYCLRNHASVVVNSMPLRVTEKVHTHSYAGFSNYAKKYMISEYSEFCNIEDCYVCN